MKKLKGNNFKFELVSLNNLEEVANIASNNKPILVTGSLYLIGEILKKN